MVGYFFVSLQPQTVTQKLRFSRVQLSSVHLSLWQNNINLLFYLLIKIPAYNHLLFSEKDANFIDLWLNLLFHNTLYRFAFRYFFILGEYIIKLCKTVNLVNNYVFQICFLQIFESIFQSLYKKMLQRKIIFNSLIKGENQLVLALRLMLSLQGQTPKKTGN